MLLAAGRTALHALIAALKLVRLALYALVAEAAGRALIAAFGAEIAPRRFPALAGVFTAEIALLPAI